METIPVILLTMAMLSLGLSSIFLIQARNYYNKTQDTYDKFAQKQKELREELNKMKGLK